MNVLEYARWYVSQGLSVIPVKADGSKSPAVTGWRKYSAVAADDETLQTWFGGAAPVGVGVTAGPASGNLVVLDFECVGDQSAYTDWVKRLPEELRAVVDALPAVVTPSGGRHLWVRLPEPQPGAKLARYAAGKTKIEIRGEGHQVLAPGCPAECHKTGRLYEWANPPGDGTDGRPSFPEIDPDVWAGLCEHAAACNEYDPPDQPRDRDTGDAPAGQDSPGNDFNARGSWAEAGLFDAGWTWARQLDGSERGFLTRPGKASGISASLGMVRSRDNGFPYLYVWSTSTDFAAETPYSRFAVFAALKHGGDYSAAAKALAGMGYGRKRKEPEIDLSGFRFGTTPDGKPAYPFATPLHPPPAEGDKDTWFKWASELNTQDDDAKWLWRGYLARGAITLLSAIWKSGKSTLLSHLVKSLDGSQSQFLGREVSPAKILYVTEEHEGIWADRRDDLLIGNHVGFKCQPTDQRANARAWADFIDQIAERVQRHGFDLVVFDTLSKIWPVQDENSAAQVEAALTPLWRLAGKLGVAVLLVHHTRKSGGTQFTAARGSGGLSAFADILIEFRPSSESKQETKRVLEAKGRYKDTPGELLAELTPGGYVVHGDPNNAAVRAATRRFDWEDDLRAALAEAEWRTVDQLNEGIAERRDDKKVKNNDIVAVLSKWFEGGEIDRDGDGKRDSPYVYRCLM